MGNNNIDNREWSDAVSSSLRDAESMPSDQLWARLEKSSVASIPPKRLLKGGYKWIAAVAAVLLFGVLTMQLWESDPQIKNELLVAIDQREESVDSEVEVVDLISEQPEVAVAEVRRPVKTISADKIERVVSHELEKEEVREQQLVSPIIESDESEERVEQSDEKDSVESNKYSFSDYKQQSPARKGTKIKSRAMLALNMGHRSTMSYDAIPMNDGYSQSFASDFIASSGYMKLNVEQEYKSSSVKHRQPMGVAMGVGFDLNRHLSLVTGVNYTLLASDVTMSFDSREVVQKVHFVGLPVRLDYNLFERNNFSVYAGAGAMVEYCLSAKVGDAKMDETPFHYSLGGVVGAKYDINNWFGLYVEPDVSYYFTPTKLRTIRNDSPTTFTIRMGVRFSL